MSNYDDIFANSQNENQVENAPQEFNKEDWVAKKQMEREQTYTMMNDMTEKVASDAEAFKQYLDVQSRFDRFSVGNVMLIAAQMPEAKRLGIATVDIATVEETIEKSRNKENTAQPAPERVGKEKSKEEKLVDEILKKPNPTKEEVQNVNPSTARTEKGSNQSEPYSNNNESQPQKNSSLDKSRKPSVRKELNDIRKEQDKRRENKTQKTRENVHKAPKKNKKKKEKSR